MADDDRGRRPGGRLSRRQLLAAGAAGGGAVLAGLVMDGYELAEHGVVPGKGALDRLVGACHVAYTPPPARPPGPRITTTFWSPARRREVRTTVAYPPGHGPGDVLPLVVVLHGAGADHTTAFTELHLDRALGMEVGGRLLAPMALVTVDGGPGYWHAHPGDDPASMVVDELVPRCRAQGLGAAPGTLGCYGWSMGGYGALLLAEQHPGLFGAVAATSPAVWTTYEEARSANGAAFTSPSDFAANDVLRHAGALAGTPVRVDWGTDDPFAPGAAALARVLPPGAVVHAAPGCHDSAFMTSVQPAAFSFLARHLARG